MLKVNYKKLKAILVLEVKKLGPAFLIPKLGNFSLFNSFLDIANISLFENPNLNNFLPFDNFLIFGFGHFSID